MSLKNKLLALGLSSALATSAAYLGSREGLSLTPYKDGGGVVTWCYGQTVGKAKARYTEQECLVDLAKTTAEYHKAVMLKLPHDAPDSVQAAFTSLAVNTGKAGWVHPIFLEPISRRDWHAACNAIEAPWKGRLGVSRGYKATINGVPSRGLENRRRADAALCRSGL